MEEKLFIMVFMGSVKIKNSIIGTIVCTYILYEHNITYVLHFYN